MRWGSALKALYFDSKSLNCLERKTFINVPKLKFTIGTTLITLLRIPYLGRFGSTMLVLPKWPKYGILDRVIRVLHTYNRY